MKKVTIFIAVVMVICMLAGFVGLSLASKNDKPSDIPKQPSNDNQNQSSIVYNKVNVTNLQEKVSKLNFETKLTSIYDGQDGEPKLNVTVENGVAKLTYNIDSTNKTYEVTSLNNVISCGITYSVQGNGGAVTYLLTSDGKVYKIYDNFMDLNNVGKLIELNVNNANAIAVDNTTLQDSALAGYPMVVIKTNDNKILTDDTNLTDNNTLVEVVE